MGTIIHQMAELALQQKENPTALFEKCKKEWDIIQSGSLKLSPSKANPQGFMQKYAMDFDWNVNPCDIEVEMFSDKLMLKGTCDLLTMYKGKLAVCDWKTSRSYGKDKLDKFFKQAAAYSILLKETRGCDIEALVIMPLNPKNKSGYGAPHVSYEIEKYQSLFLEDLKQFKTIFL